MSMYGKVPEKAHFGGCEMGTKKGTFASKWAHFGFFGISFVMLHENEG